MTRSKKKASKNKILREIPSSLKVIKSLEEKHPSLEQEVNEEFEPSSAASKKSILSSLKSTPVRQQINVPSPESPQARATPTPQRETNYSTRSEYATQRGYESNSRAYETPERRVTAAEFTPNLRPQRTITSRSPALDPVANNTQLIPQDTDQSRYYNLTEDDHLTTKKRENWRR